MPKGLRGDYVSRPIWLAERALGKTLPDGALVHHLNGNPFDHRPCNLVICQDGRYHVFLHQRMNARWIACIPHPSTVARRAWLSQRTDRAKTVLVPVLPG